MIGIPTVKVRGRDRGVALVCTKDGKMTPLPQGHGRRGMGLREWERQRKKGLKEGRRRKGRERKRRGG